jgi:hypothetical protein
MKENVYTAEDIKVLCDMSGNTSPLRLHMPKHDYDPQEFKDFISCFKKEFNFVFLEPYDELPLKISDLSINGYLQWRLKIGK